jgi:hypothetical protein
MYHEKSGISGSNGIIFWALSVFNVQLSVFNVRLLVLNVRLSKLAKAKKRKSALHATGLHRWPAQFCSKNFCSNKFCLDFNRSCFATSTNSIVFCKRLSLSIQKKHSETFLKAISRKIIEQMKLI